MKKVWIFVILIVVIVGAALVFDRDKDMKKENDKAIIREPAVAGAFYPGTEAELSMIVDEYMSEVQPPTVGKYVRGMIVPHAGYVYSGQVAAYGYKTLEGQDIATVILIGNSHKERFDGVSVFSEGHYKTPLGNVEIDKDLAKKIIDFHEKISFRESAHSEEHSLEVQLPFLQRVLDDFKIVPIIIGNQPGAVDILIDVLKDLIDDKTLLIASSDLSHYPKYEDAMKLDNEFIQAILKRQEFPKDVSSVQTRACGQDAIEVVIGLLGDEDIKLLKYANSGDVDIGDKDRVVGYAAIVFSSVWQERLLEIAREIVQTYITTGKVLEFSNNLPDLEKHLGAFVTIKKHGQLRGCIGVFEPDMPLYKVVIDMAISAATRDHRFKPVTKDELDDLEYEISVLSPLKKVDSWKDIEIGKHGVRIVKGLRSGVFLPQVATDNNWDLDTFMNVLCTQKAGLSADCWKNDPQVEIYVFTAKVF